jgi:hypothetical protein
MDETENIVTPINKHTNPMAKIIFLTIDHLLLQPSIHYPHLVLQLRVLKIYLISQIIILGIRSSNSCENRHLGR